MCCYSVLTHGDSVVEHSWAGRCLLSCIPGQAGVQGGGRWGGPTLSEATAGPVWLEAGQCFAALLLLLFVDEAGRGLHQLSPRLNFNCAACTCGAARVNTALHSGPRRGQDDTALHCGPTRGHRQLRGDKTGWQSNQSENGFLLSLL